MSTALLTDSDLIRTKTLVAVKKHRSAWIDLGQYLLTIHKDKLYRKWGHLSFEGYCVKELFIKQSTASKLLKSYAFLEREDPRFLDSSQTDDAQSQRLPNYESVNLLRLAVRNEQLTSHDVAEIRRSVLDKGSEPKEVRTQLKNILSANADIGDPREIRAAHRNAVMKRLLTVLVSAKKELSKARLAPAYLLKQMEDLAGKIEDQIE